MKNYSPEASTLLSSDKQLPAEDARQAYITALEQADENGYQRRKDEEDE